MADLPNSGRRASGTPRWVTASGVVVVALAVLFLVVHLVMGGGLASHMP